MRWLKRSRSFFIKTRHLYEQHKVLVTLGLIYTCTRLLAAFFTQMTFAPYGPGFSEFRRQARFSINHSYPFLDYWMEYPPMFPWLTVAAHRLSLLIPSWNDSGLWFGATLRWGMVPFEVGALTLVYAIGKQIHSERKALYSTLLYALTFVTIYVPLGWFDLVPMFWLLLATYFLLHNRAAWTGISVGLGLLAKPISALALPAAWQRLTLPKARARLVLTTVLAFVIPMLPFLIASPDITWAHFRNLLTRTSWETVWAFLDGYFSYGKVTPLDQRFDPTTALQQTHPGGNYSLGITLAFGALGLFLWTRPINWQDARRTLAFIGLTWAIFSLWSKGYSPQWSINFVPFLALLMPDLRGVIHLGLLSLVLVAEWPLAFILAGAQKWYLIAVVVWRTLFFILLALELGSMALNGRASRVGRRTYWTATVLLIISALMIGGRFMHDYFDARLRNEPLNPAVQVLEQEKTPHTGLICREANVCERIAPFIRDLDFYWLPTCSGWQADQLPTFTQKHPRLWLVEEFSPGIEYDLSIERCLSERYGKAAQEWVEGARISRFVALTLPPEEDVNVRFGDCLTLSSYAIRAEGSLVNLKLSWEALCPINTSYKVFVHLRDGDGRLIAQNDQVPGGGFEPTTEWAVGEIITDLHGLTLSGTYPEDCVLQLGLYSPNTGQRLTIQGTETDVFEIRTP